MNVFTLEIDPKEIRLLETNARYMKHEEFKRLTENIRRDGKLTSTPFLCKDDDGHWLCLSGNHRTQAAIEVGLSTITCLATDDPLTKEQQIAIQLSHNSITGQDDPATLKILYEQILDTDWKQYSGLDDKTLSLLDKVSNISISEANLQFQTLSMVFLPDELDAARKVIDEAKEQVKSSHDVWLARMNEYEDWLDAQEVVSSSYNVKNVATAVEIILKIFRHNITQCSEGWKDTTDNKRYVPIETVLGRMKIPAESAKLIKKAIDRMIGKEELDSKERWRAIELWATKYLES